MASSPDQTESLPLLVEEARDDVSKVPVSAESATNAAAAGSPSPLPCSEAAPAPSASSPPRRALTFEEFREFYAASRRADYSCHAVTDDAVHHPIEAEQLGARRAASEADDQARRRRLAAELCADLTALARERHGGAERRPHGVPDFARAMNNAGGAGVGGNPRHAAAQPQPPQPQAGFLARAGGAAGGALGWLLRQAADNVATLLQFAFLGYLVYSQTDGSGTIMLMLLILCAVFSVMRALVNNFRIGHETGTVSAPSFLGRLFKPAGQTEPVSTVRKVGYMAAKCVEAFLLSIFPTYSVERLETELQVDGIVRSS